MFFLFLPKGTSQALGWWYSCDFQLPRSSAITFHYASNTHSEVGPYKPIWTLTHYQCGINPNRWVNHHHLSLDRMVVETSPTTLHSYRLWFEIDAKFYLSIQFRALKLCFHCFSFNCIIHIQSLIFISMHKKI